MSGYLSRISKAIWSYLPFRGNRNGDCGNCESCKSVIKCESRKKRKLEPAETQLGSSDQIPEKKMALDVSSSATDSKPADIQDQVGTSTSSAVNVQIMETLSQLTKIVTEMNKKDALVPHLDAAAVVKIATEVMTSRNPAHKSATESTSQSLTPTANQPPTAAGSTAQNISSAATAVAVAPATTAIAPATSTAAAPATSTAAAPATSAAAAPVTSTAAAAAPASLVAAVACPKASETTVVKSSATAAASSTSTGSKATSGITTSTTSTASTTSAATATTSADAGKTVDDKTAGSEDTSSTVATDDAEAKAKKEKEEKEEQAFIASHEVALKKQVTRGNAAGNSIPCCGSKPWTEPIEQGLEKQVEYLQHNVVAALKHQEIIRSARIALPKGIYLHGPGAAPKSLTLVKALAEALSLETGKDWRLFRKMDTDVFSKYGSEWKQFVQLLFSVAVKAKPAIVLIQDIDVLCSYCEYDISTNKELVKRLAEEVDKIIPGEAVVVLTVNDLKKTFPALRIPAAFQHYIEISDDISTKSIISSLKRHTSSWIGNTASAEEKSTIEAKLEKVAEKILQVPSIACPDEIAQLCSDAHQKAVLNKIKSTIKPCNCQCCVSTITTVFPEMSDWNDCVMAMTERKKPAKPGINLKSTEAAATAAEENHCHGFSFAQVGGLEKQIEILKENIVVPLKNKATLKDLGWNVQPVRGFIFHGPPGTGKTLLGKALAAELSQLEDGKKFSFIYHKGTECFSMYVGQTEEKLRNIFENAKKKKPAIIFLDEIDGLCSARSDEGGNRFLNGIVTTILGLMDNIPRGEVFVIAATNRLSSLDPAFRRPGRFDKCIQFEAPDEDGRKNILEIHTSTWKSECKMPQSFLVDIASKTVGYTGADLEQLCRQAFVFAMRRHNSKPSEPTGEPHESNKGDVALTNLRVSEQDWYAALGVVRSSGSNYFNNTVVCDKPIPKTAVTALQNKIEIVTMMLTPVLTKWEEKITNFGNDGSLETFLIWCKKENQRKVVENLFIPHLFSSVPFRCATTVKLELTQKPSDVATILQQVIKPGEGRVGILFVPNIDFLLDPKHISYNASDVAAAHKSLLNQLEKLRGEKVILLGTSGRRPSEIAQEVQVLFRDVNNSKRYEFEAPTAEDIRNMFTEYASKISVNAFEKLVRILTATGSGSSIDAVHTIDVNIYDLLDFKSEMDVILSNVGIKDEIPNDILDEKLIKLAKAFVSNLNVEGTKSRLNGMYT